MKDNGQGDRVFFSISTVLIYSGKDGSLFFRVEELVSLNGKVNNDEPSKCTNHCGNKTFDDENS